LGKTIGRRIDDDAKITVRGKAMYSKAANRIEDILGSDMVGTAAFRTNAWALVPDAKSKVGDIFAPFVNARPTRTRFRRLEWGT
jgi:hypothetical protein